MDAVEAMMTELLGCTAHKKRRKSWLRLKNTIQRNKRCKNLHPFLILDIGVNKFLKPPLMTIHKSNILSHLKKFVFDHTGYHAF